MRMEMWNLNLPMHPITRSSNKDSINTTKDNENAEDNTTIPASNADNAKSDAWNPAIIIIIGICILLIVVGAVIFVRKKSGSEEE